MNTLSRAADAIAGEQPAQRTGRIGIPGGLARFRWHPLRNSLGFAALFVAFRVFYRVLFNGASGAGITIIDIPAVQLAAPFSHIYLFGPVTTGGLLNTIESALPFVLLIVALGMCNSCLESTRLFARWARGGRLSGISRALVIAWATFPALTETVRTVLRARQLRGERSAASFFTPLFERTIERALAIGAALELRGFAGTLGDVTKMQFDAGSGTFRGDGSSVEIHNARFSYPYGVWSLRVNEFVPKPGTVNLITGDTGSGKSTLLHVISGLFEHVWGGVTTGTVRVAGVDRSISLPRETAKSVAAVMQQPDQGFTSETVFTEIGLGLEFMGVPSTLITKRVQEIAGKLEITRLLNRSIHQLSAGEAMLVAIAGAVITNPGVLLVDEPLADLDELARNRVSGVLANLAHESGICVIIAEHRIAQLAMIADATYRIADGLLTEALTDFLTPAPCLDTPGPGDSRAVETGVVAGAEAGAGTGFGRSALLTVRDLPVRQGQVVVGRVTFTLGSGEIVVISGANGAGKSTLLDSMARPQRPRTWLGRHVRWHARRYAKFERFGSERFGLERFGSVTVNEVNVSELDARARRSAISLVPEKPDNLLFGRTIAEECSRADISAGAARGTTAARFQHFHSQHSTPPVGYEVSFWERHPHDLSVGERRLLALAVQLAANPKVLLIDEPTQGLDDTARWRVAQALRQTIDTGCGVIIATHDQDFAAAVGDRELRLHAGRLREASLKERRSPAPNLTRDAVVRERYAGVNPDSAAGVDRKPEASGDSERQPETRDSPRATTVSSLGATAVHLRPATTMPNLLPTTVQPLGKYLLTGTPIFTIINVLAALTFAWPLVAAALPDQINALFPAVSLILAPLLVVVMMLALDRSVRSATILAMLGVLVAITAGIRIAGTGVGGVEAVFVLLIVSGRVFGARFGFLLGVLGIAFSALLQGGLGPWTPYQMIACGWVAAGAGLLPGASGRAAVGRAAVGRTRGSAAGSIGKGIGRGWYRASELAMLCGYGVLAAYLFGLVMNLWFWPFAVGGGAGISYIPGASLSQNLSSFLLYSLITSTVSWDTIRAITTVVGLLVIGPGLLASLRRLTFIRST